MSNQHKTPRTFVADHGIGDTVYGLGRRGKVIAVIFTVTGTMYELEDEAGGAHHTLASSDVAVIGAPIRTDALPGVKRGVKGVEEPGDEGTA